MIVFVLGFLFVFVILKGKIINLWSLFIHDFLMVFFFIFQCSSFDFFDFLYLNILLNLGKHNLKKSGQTFFFFNFWARVWASAEFFFLGLGHGLGPNCGMADRARRYPTGRV